MNITNLAVNGRTLQDIMNSTDYEIPEDCDYITIMIGLNDLSASNPIGIPSDDYAYNRDHPTEWCASWFNMSYWLTLNRPHTILGVLIISAYLTNEYRDSCIIMCKKFRIPYLDMYRDTKVPNFMNKEGILDFVNSNVYAANKVCPENSHPSVECHEFMSTFIEEFMRGI